MGKGVKLAHLPWDIVHCEHRARCPHPRGGKGKGKENKHVFNSIPQAVPICWNQPQGPDQGRTMPCHHLPVEQLLGPVHTGWRATRGAQPSLCDPQQASNAHIFSLPHANELPISCFHHRLSSDVTNFQDRREHARPTASRDAGTQGSGHPCSRAGDAAQPSQNGADLSAKPSQMGQIYQPAAALLTAGAGTYVLLGEQQLCSQLCSQHDAPHPDLLQTLSSGHLWVLLASFCCSLSWQSTLGTESLAPPFPSVFTTLEGDRIQIRVCSHESILMTETIPKSSQSPVHPGKHKCQLQAQAMCPLQKGI